MCVVVYTYRRWFSKRSLVHGCCGLGGSRDCWSAAGCEVGSSASLTRDGCPALVPKSSRDGGESAVYIMKATVQRCSLGGKLKLGCIDNREPASTNASDTGAPIGPNQCQPMRSTSSFCVILITFTNQLLPDDRIQSREIARTGAVRQKRRISPTCS